MKKTLFGVAGNPPNFWNSEFKKKRTNAPEWLNSIGLDALEVQCGYGVRTPDKTAEDFFLKSGEFNIALSLHGPYYISIGTKDQKKIQNSLNELRKSVELAKKIGTKRVIFHPGSAGKNREEALEQAIKTLIQFEKENDLGEVKLFPEIAGKINQLGSLDEIVTICREVHSAYPCLDLAHLHARTYGSLKSKKDYEKILEKIQKQVGIEALKNLHIHLYPVEWGNGGEVRHKAFSDKKINNIQLNMFPDELDEPFFLPRYEPFLEAIVDWNLQPVIICEAKDSQDLGALEMKDYYLKLLGSEVK